VRERCRLWFQPMQLREGSFHGPRPGCPEHPKQRVHRHGFYIRFENCDSQRRLRIERFLCPRCGRTLSVLPKNRLPYIALNTTILEREFDARASGTDPPLVPSKQPVTLNFGSPIELRLRHFRQETVNFQDWSVYHPGRKNDEYN
jgi:hypothetical protein